MARRGTRGIPAHAPIAGRSRQQTTPLGVARRHPSERCGVNLRPRSATILRGRGAPLRTDSTAREGSLTADQTRAGREEFPRSLANIGIASERHADNTPRPGDRKVLDNLGRRSAERIDPTLQTLTVGDWIPMSAQVTDRTAFRVEGMAAPHWMLWTKPDITWEWRLEPADGGSTRLVTRLLCRYAWRDFPGVLATIALMELADYPMMRRMLLGIRAGRSPRRPRCGPDLPVGGALR